MKRKEGMKELLSIKKHKESPYNHQGHSVLAARFLQKHPVDKLRV